MVTRGLLKIKFSSFLFALFCYNIYMSDFLINLISTYKYLIIFPFAVVEGTTAALVSGFFVSLGTLSFILSYITLLLGDLIPDVILYYIGWYGNKKNFLLKFGPKIGLRNNAENSLHHMWFDHGAKAFLFGKLSYGIAVPFLISAGLVKYSFRKYMTFCTAVSGVKVFITLTIGYYLGSSYKLASKYIDYFYIVVAIIFITLIISYIFFARKMKRNFQELEKEAEIR